MEGVIGSRFADTITGSIGSDIIAGGGGADTLKGDPTNSVLNSDTFVFFSANDSSATVSGEWSASASDTILDFQPGKDLLDLFAVDANTSVSGDQAFTWAGLNPASTAAKQNSVWTTQDTTDTFVYADLNGDGIADLVIKLVGLHNLSQSDFVL
jgi:serralysin